MNTLTRTAHEELRAKIERGEFRVARGKDIAPYLPEVIPCDEMVELVRLAVAPRVRQHAHIVLAALDQLFAGEHDGALPLTNAYTADEVDYYYRQGAAWLLSKALLVEREADIIRLCEEVRNVGI